MDKQALFEKAEEVFKECKELLDKGQQEYSHREDNVFANFDRVGERMNLDPKQVLMVYEEKHSDGIHSFIKGHRSQREDVRGRINDKIVYNIILRAMIDEEDNDITL